MEHEDRLARAFTAVDSRGTKYTIEEWKRWKMTGIASATDDRLVAVNRWLQQPDATTVVFTSTPWRYKLADGTKVDAEDQEQAPKF